MNNYSYLKKVKILKENSDYRVSDIIYHLGYRWEHSKNKVLSEPKYNDTILKNHLLNCDEDNNLKHLLQCIRNYNNKNNLIKPSKDELVIHLRMGDVVENEWFMKKKYINMIKNLIKYSYFNKQKINKITIVTCFAYQVWSEDSLEFSKDNKVYWNYTDEKQEKNNKAFLNFINKLRKNFKLPIKIYSNTNIDKDFCYCVFSNYFINDKGGFSKLLLKLNILDKKQNNNKNL